MTVVYRVSLTRVRTGKEKSTKRKEFERWDRAVLRVIASSRQDSDITQEELANRLGWTRAQVVNIEHGRRAVRVSDLIMIAKALNLEIETLLRRITRW